MVDPKELQDTEFSKSFKGYTCAEVDKYVEYVIEQYTELYRQNIELEKKIRVLSSKLDEAKSEQSSISATIVNAQIVADKIVKDANEKASDINAAIQVSFDETLAKYREMISEEQAKLYEAQKAAVEFKAGLLAGYKEQVRSICELIPIDSMDDICVRNVEEVVDSTVASAGDRLGLRKKSGEAEADTEEEIAEETEAPASEEQETPEE